MATLSSSSGECSTDDFSDWELPEDYKRTPFTHIVPGNTPSMKNLCWGFNLTAKTKRKEGYPIDCLYDAARMGTVRRSDELMVINGFNLAKKARHTSGANKKVKEIIRQAAETKTDLVMHFIRDWYDLVLKEDLPPLHQACDRGDLEAVKKYANKDNVNEEDGMHHYPIHRAAASNNVEIMEVLKSHGVDVHARDRENRSALHWAASASAINTIRWLFKEGVDPAVEDFHTHNFMHVLMILAETEVACTVCLEFKEQLRPLANLYANGNVTPLQMVMRREDQDLELTRILVHELGADVHYRNYYYREALHFACENPCIPRIEFLLRFGANLFATTNTQRTPFHYHIGDHRASVEVMEYLINQGSKCDEWTTDGHSPLQILVKNAYHNLDAIELLIKRGADVNAKSKFVRLPIHLLLEFKKFPMDTAALLIKYGADVRAKLGDQSEIMHHICKRKKVDMEVIYFLLRNGAKVVVTNRAGFQPLHHLAIHGTAAQAILFIGFGADPNWKTAEKRTAFDFALQNSNFGVVDVLDKLRDKSHHPNYDKARKYTPLEVAQGIYNLPKDVTDIMICLDKRTMEETYSGKEPHEIAVEIGASQNVIDILKAHGGREPVDLSYNPTDLV